MNNDCAGLGARFAAAVLVFGALTACGKSEGARGGGPPGGGSSPGALAKPIDQYTGDELYALTRQLSFGGGTTHGRHCRGRATCAGNQPSDSTVLRVDGVAGEDSLSAASLPANGVIAVRVVNRGTLSDSLYQTTPGTTYESYLIVTPRPGGASWRLEELATGAGSRSHRMIASGTLRECPRHAFQRGPKADFKTCELADQVRPASFGALMQGSIDPPIWFGCAVGCCTADPPGISG